jgi:hypothetical protein
MTQQEKPDPSGTQNEWDAVSRQSKALKEMDEVIKSNEPAGEKLKRIVGNHSNACDEIKEKLAAHK